MNQSGKLLFMGIILSFVWGGQERPFTQQDDADKSGTVILSVKWNSDGSKLAVGKGHAICGTEFGDERFAIQIIDGETEQLTDSLIQPRCSARSLAWSPSSDILISGSDDAGMWFWNATTMKYIGNVTVAFGGPSTLVWRNTQQLFGLVESSIYSYDVPSQTISFDFPDHKTKQVTSIALSPDRSQLASGDSDGVIRIIDTSTRQRLESFQPEPHTVTALDWSSDGSRLASGYSDGTVKVWDAVSRTPLLTFVDQTDVISQIKWKPNTDIFASGSYDGTILVWNLKTDVPVVISYPGKVLALDWKPDGSKLAYGGVRNDFQDTDILIVDPSQLPTATSIPAVKSITAGKTVTLAPLKNSPLYGLNSHQLFGFVRIFNISYV